MLHMGVVAGCLEDVANVGVLLPLCQSLSLVLSEVGLFVKKKVNFMKIFAVMTLILSISVANLGFAHSGGTDKYGCHAGSQPYHCHGESTGGSTGGGIPGIPKATSDDGLSGGEIAGLVLGGMMVVGIVLVLVLDSSSSSSSSAQPIADSDNELAGLFNLPAVDVLIGEESGGLQLKWFW